MNGDFFIFYDFKLIFMLQFLKIQIFFFFLKISFFHKQNGILTVLSNIKFYDQNKFQQVININNQKKLMFCGFCQSNDDKQYEIEIRNPYDMRKSKRVGHGNQQQLMQAIGEMVTYNTVIPSRYFQYLQQCRRTKTNFRDKQFPPEQSSLNFSIQNRKIIWKRIPQFIQNPQLFKDGINPSDVQQGNLGDCYFLSCIASISQVPERIKKIFCYETEMKPEGIYRLQLSISGQYTEVVIDDYIPVYEGSNRPVFCKSVNSEAWVMLLEKAWAKLKGSYGDTSAGYPHQVLNTFSVAPCFYYQISDSLSKDPISKIILWNTVKSGIQNKMPMCAGSRQAYTCKGIKAAHTYSVLDAEQVQFNNKGTIETYYIVTLRNPWGDAEYMGKYSQCDHSFWEKASSKSRYRKQNLRDGIFTLSFDEFVRNFQSIDISHDLQDYNNIFEKAKIKSFVPIFYEFNVLQSSNSGFFFSVEKIFDRNIYFKKRRVEFGYIRILLVKKRTQMTNSQQIGYQYIFSCLETNFPDLNHVQSGLAPGSYILMVQTEFPDSEQGQITLNFYNKDVQFNFRLTESVQPNFLQKVFTNHALQKISRSDRTLLSPSLEDWTVSHFLLKQIGFGYLFITLGRMSTEKIQITTNLEKIGESGFILLEKNTRQKKRVITKGQRQILIFAVDFRRSFRQITFPPKGIKICKIL